MSAWLAYFNALWQRRLFLAAGLFTDGSNVKSTAAAPPSMKGVAVDAIWRAASSFQRLFSLISPRFSAAFWLRFAGPTSTIQRCRKIPEGTDGLKLCDYAIILDLHS